MSIKVGDTLLNGQVAVIEVSNGLITKVSVPRLGDGSGPLVIDFAPGQTPAFIESLLGPLLA